jgi:hypothetical protein
MATVECGSDSVEQGRRRTNCSRQQTARSLHWCEDASVGCSVTKRLVGFTSEVQRPVPSRPNTWDAPAPIQPSCATWQPEPRKLPRLPPATDYAAALATGPGDGFGEPGGTFWLNETDTCRVG